jgi:hypothetical protein
MVLSGLEAHADNKDSLAELNTGVTALKLAGSAKLIHDLLGLGGRALVHLVGAGLEKRELAVGEEVVGVDRDAVTTNTETGSVGHVTEGLSGSSTRHLEGVNAKTLASVGHLVGIGDAHHALAVLVELAHLSNLRLGDRDNAVEDAAIETDNSVERSRDDIIEARNNLGDGSHGRLNTAGVNALGRHSGEETLGLSNGAKEFASEADRDRALNDNSAARTSPLLNTAKSRAEIRQINGPVRAKKGRDRDKEVGSVAKIRLVGSEGDVGSSTELSPEELKTIFRDVKAHDLVLGRERVNKTSTNEANADHCDKRSSLSGCHDRLGG